MPTPAMLIGRFTGRYAWVALSAPLLSDAAWVTSPDSVSYRAVTPEGAMVGFIVGLVEPDFTGHVTTLGVAPEHRRRGIANRMLVKAEDGFRRRNVRIVRLEVRSVNHGAQDLYRKLGYAVTQRLPRYYSNGGDGLLMIKSLV